MLVAVRAKGREMAGTLRGGEMRDCVALATEHGFTLWAALGRILQGWADAQKREATTGIVRIRDGLAAAEATGTRTNTPFYLTLLAEALALAVKIEEAVATLDDALAKAAVSGAKGWDAEIHRLYGDLTGRLPYPDPARVEESLRTALALAREQDARGCGLRATTSPPGCGASRAGGARHSTCWHAFAAPSPRASTPPT
jgi:predicted ATPase